ncbi:MAG TPA: ABC transporter ATP-binding protein [Rhodospirillales bacterium]|jgi:iron(III) transport system ATP-binding protein
MKGVGLHLNNVSHAYDPGMPVLNGVSVFVAPGEIVCLLGPSGCGKTTLLRVAAGLELLQVGQIRVGERVVAEGRHGIHVPPEKRGIGLMFQDYALFPHLTVFDNVAFALSDSSARRDWVRQALGRVGLAEYADAYPHILSGGEQQRVALLRALAPEPQVMLLDEPFSGLDVTRRASIRAETLGLLKETAVATLMVTHDPEEAMFMADRILVMNEGRIVQDGTPVDTYFRPATAFVAALFGAVNRLSGVVAKGRVATPLGSFEAPAMGEGAKVEILIRPEGLRVSRPDETPEVRAGDLPWQPAAGLPPVTAVSARSLGRSSFLVLSVPDGNGAALTIEARVPGVFLPKAGEPVAVTVNPRQAHVFPAA